MRGCCFDKIGINPGSRGQILIKNRTDCLIEPAMDEFLQQMVIMWSRSSARAFNFVQEHGTTKHTIAHMEANLFFRGLLGTGACLASVLSAAAADQDRRPNILFILADDLGWGDVGYHGSEISTPHIDSLCRRGIEMNRFYTAPVSSPTRAGLLTGRYPSRFGIRKTVIPPWRDYGLDPGEMTLADLLAGAGYRHRAMIGKWHLGHGRRAYYPLNRGFTHFYGCLNGAIDYFTHEREGELDWHDDWDSCHDPGYSTDLIAEEAVRCIGEYASEDPFFLYVAFNAPHTPYQVPDDALAELVDPELFARLSPAEQRAWTYRAMVTRLDRGIGRILQELERRDLLEQTLILFMSDNGGVPNVPGGSSSAPLRGHKGQEWDGGVRVPAVLYWKGHFLEGVRLDQLAAFVDLVPTIASLVGAGEPPRPYDGVDLLPVLTGESAPFARDLYLGCGAAVCDDCKLILQNGNRSMKLSSDYLVYYPEDAYEARNDLAAHQAEAERLRAFILRYDTIRPSHREIPYGKGREGFKAPKEWRVVKP